MAPEDIAARFKQVMEVIERGDPYVKPAVWISGIMVQNSTAESVHAAQDRLLTRDCEMAERFLRHLFNSTCSHDLRTAVMECLHRDDGSDPERLGRKFALAIEALSHPRLEGECKAIQDQLRDRLFEACERWAWKTKDAMALKSILNGTPASLERGRSLYMALRDGHPNSGVRDIARLSLLNYAEYKRQEELNRGR